LKRCCAAIDTSRWWHTISYSNRLTHGCMLHQVVKGETRLEAGGGGVLRRVEVLNLYLINSSQQVSIAPDCPCLFDPQLTYPAQPNPPLGFMDTQPLRRAHWQLHVKLWHMWVPGGSTVCTKRLYCLRIGVTRACASPCSTPLHHTSQPTTTLDSTLMLYVGRQVIISHSYTDLCALLYIHATMPSAAK
jgi:hypothetical protein